MKFLIKNTLVNIKNRPRNNMSKVKILNYFQYLKNNNLMLTGQQVGDGSFDINQKYQDFVVELKKQTGNTPAIIGSDYGWKENNDLSKVNKVLIEHYKKGGLVTLSWHGASPFCEGYNPRFSPTVNRNAIDFNKLLKSAPQTKEKDKYRNEIHKIALGLRELKDNNVIVLFRPFHEMNADWFWWGIDRYNGLQTNKQSFINLWIDLYDTLTFDYKIDNLLWIYSPNRQTGSYSIDVLHYYPSNKYVDLVGISDYSQDLSLTDYEKLETINKTFVISEMGGNKEFKHDMVELVEKLKGKATYFVFWHSYNGVNRAIIDNDNYKKMMKLSNVINLEDIKM